MKKRGRADPEVTKQLGGLNADLMHLYELEWVVTGLWKSSRTGTVLDQDTDVMNPYKAKTVPAVSYSFLESVFVSAGLGAGGSSGVSGLVSRYCTISEMRRFEGSRASFALRNR
jgi:hypothetical protein